MVDIIAYVGSIFDDKTGERKAFLWTRETPNIAAGSRFRYLAPKIPNGYQNLVDAIETAIEKQRIDDGDAVIDKQDSTSTLITAKTFDDLMNEAKNLWSTLINEDPENGQKMSYIVERIMGQGAKLSQATERQKDLVEMVVEELKTLKK